jgi:hypothetical protein
MLAATIVAMSVMIAFFCGQTRAIKCYSCSAGDACKDPFNAAKVSSTNCLTLPLIKGTCSKTISGGIVARACGALIPGFSAGCSSKDGVTTCLCTGDNCNGATMVTLGHVVLALSLSAVVAVVQIFGRLCVVSV